MQLEDDVRIGTRVRVQVDYLKPHRRGAIGTIKKCYGGADYQVFEVSFPDGQTQLFWQHQLKQVKGSSPLSKRLRLG